MVYVHRLLIYTLEYTLTDARLLKNVITLGTPCGVC